MSNQNTPKSKARKHYKIVPFAVLSILTISIIATISISLNMDKDVVFAQVSTQDPQTEDNSMNSTNVPISASESNQTTVTVFPANFTRAIGTISSIQNNETGKPGWILSGTWELLIPKPLKINQTNPSDATPFTAIFEMVKTDGTMRHTHAVSDFNLTGSQANNNALVLTGKATVLMNEGPVKNVPVSLSIVDQDALKLWIYPSVPSTEVKDNHFGNTPIYGLVSSIGTFFTFP